MEEYNALNEKQLDGVSGGNARPTRDYQIKAGDTLEKIAKRVGTTVETLAKLNGFTGVPALCVGEFIRVPR